MSHIITYSIITQNLLYRPMLYCIALYHGTYVIIGSHVMRLYKCIPKLRVYCDTRPKYNDQLH